MSTGDLRNNIAKLESSLKSIKYPGVLDGFGIARGDSSTFLPFLHYLLLDFSPIVATYISDRKYELFGKKDFRFIEEVYTVLRNELNYKPKISKEQFFAKGFAERKCLLVVDVIGLIKTLNAEISRQTKPISAKRSPSVQSTVKEAPSETFWRRSLTINNPPPVPLAQPSNALGSHNPTDDSLLMYTSESRSFGSPEARERFSSMSDAGKADYVTIGNSYQESIVSGRIQTERYSPTRSYGTARGQSNSPTKSVVFAASPSLRERSQSPTREEAIARRQNGTTRQSSDIIQSPTRDRSPSRGSPKRQLPSKIDTGTQEDIREELDIVQRKLSEMEKHVEGIRDLLVLARLDPKEYSGSGSRERILAMKKKLLS